MRLCKIILLLFLLVPVFFVAGQSTPSTAGDKRIDSLLQLSTPYFVLPANKQLRQVSWYNSIYIFPAFANGRITFATGYSPPDQVRMNYNLYFAQIDYINADGDTLQIKPSKELKLVTLNDRVFYYDIKIGFMEVLQQLPVALAVQEFLFMERYEYMPGRKIAAGPDVRGATSDYDRFYIKMSKYYLIDKDNKVYKAELSSLYTIFRDHKKKIKGYMDEHHVDFDDREDLIDLMKFCNDLN